jgi:hypothetical protein
MINPPGSIGDSGSVATWRVTQIVEKKRLLFNDHLEQLDGSIQTLGTRESRTILERVLAKCRMISESADVPFCAYENRRSTLKILIYKCMAYRQTCRKSCLCGNPVDLSKSLKRFGVRYGI